jgi:hypothetical protein
MESPSKGNTKTEWDAHSPSDGRWGLRLLLCREDGSRVEAATQIRMGNDCATLAEARDYKKL